MAGSCCKLMEMDKRAKQGWKWLEVARKGFENNGFGWKLTGNSWKMAGKGFNSMEWADNI